MVIWKCTGVFWGIFRLGGGGWEGGNMLGELSLEEFVMGEKKFYDGSAGFSSIIKKKKTMKKYIKKVFSTENKERH